MPMMIAPDGIETMEVPDSLVAHYQSKGALLAEAPKPQIGGARKAATEAGLGLLGTGGAIPGAITGARLGAPLGPWGVLGGGLVGGVVGGLGGEAVAQGVRQPLGLDPMTRDESAMNYAQQGAWGGLAGLLGPGRAIPAGWAAAKELFPNLKRGGRAIAAAQAAVGGGKAAAKVTKPAGSIAGTIKPVPRGTTPMPKAASPTPSVTAAPAKAAKPMPKVPAKEATRGIESGASRHEIEYPSESGGFIRIEDMSTSHLRNAMNKLHAKIGPNPNKATPVARKQLQALKDEVTFRMKRDGQRTVPGPVGKAQTAAAAKFEDEALARATGGGRVAGSIGPATDDLAARLEQSLKFERELTRRGFTPQQRVALRRQAKELMEGGAAQ